MTSDGYSLRFSLEPFVEPSTRAGRKFARVGRGAEIVGVARVTGDEIVIAATRQARAMLCKVDEVNFLGGPGRGVILIKLQKEDDRLLGFIASTGDRDLMTVETTRGAEQTISTTKYGVTGRGGKGRELLQRGEFSGSCRRRRVPAVSKSQIFPSSPRRRTGMRSIDSGIFMRCIVCRRVSSAVAVRCRRVSGSDAGRPGRQAQGRAAGGGQAAADRISRCCRRTWTHAAGRQRSCGRSPRVSA